MSTSLVLGNGNMLINIDERLQITDLYWPHVGKNNHLMGHHIRTYFWDYGHLVSLEDENAFEVYPQYEKYSISGRSVIESEKYGLRILVENTVLPHKDIYLCKFTVTNFWDMKRDLKFFMNHDFYVKEHNVGDTTCWYPFADMLFHYKDNIYLGIGSTTGIAQYSCGKSHSNEGAGTLPDPKTGLLNGSSIDHGAVESTVGFNITVEGHSASSFDYVLVCGHNFKECAEGMEYIRVEGVDHLIQDMTNFWRSYIVTPLEEVREDGKEYNLDSIVPDPLISKRLKDLFIRSIGVIRTQIDNEGAVIAANDSVHLKYLKDTYSYLWHRDAALTVSTLDEVGYPTLSERFFRMSANLLEQDGYFFHKYNSNGTFGASWHSWVDPMGNPQLPIQEDETATVLWALWKHYEKYKNQELISQLWESLIRPAANFLTLYRYCGDRCVNNKFIKKLTSLEAEKDPYRKCLSDSGLPMPSFDLWEEVNGIHTYTASSVYGGLLGASILALKLGQHDEAEMYSKAAHEVKDSILKYLYDRNEGHFIHSIYRDYESMSCVSSERIDSSIAGIWMFGVLPVDDPKVISTMEWLEKELWSPNPVGGILRYVGDDYYRMDKTQSGNPWFITTLWMAQYHIKKNDLDGAMRYLKWVVDNSKKSDLLPEQIDCITGEDRSVKPLTWSHAELIRTINMLI